MGTVVGDLARQRFSGGRLVTAGYRQTEAALAQTAEFLADPAVPAIFEAAVLADGVLIRNSRAASANISHSRFVPAGTVGI